MNYLFDMTPVARKLDQIRNLHIGVGVKANLWVDELRAQDRESEILTGLDKFVRDAEEAREEAIAAKRELAELDRLAAHEDSLTRARCAARANPLSGNQIVLRVEEKGFRLRLNRKREIKIAPDCGLSLDDESYLIEFANLVAESLRQRNRWRTVATISEGE